MYYLPIDEPKYAVTKRPLSFPGIHSPTRWCIAGHESPIERLILKYIFFYFKHALYLSTRGNSRY